MQEYHANVIFPNRLVLNWKSIRKDILFIILFLDLWQFDLETCLKLIHTNDLGKQKETIGRQIIFFREMVVMRKIGGISKLNYKSYQVFRQRGIHNVNQKEEKRGNKNASSNDLRWFLGITRVTWQGEEKFKNWGSFMDSHLYGDIRKVWNYFVKLLIWFYKFSLLDIDWKQYLKWLKNNVSSKFTATFDLCMSYSNQRQNS